ncbi:MAG: DUF2934 domain-containing protein [Gammaproteobacteria bacterium]|nr:DUF2934 domain-containing protein [Gammaproteobacteria bacterium]
MKVAKTLQSADQSNMGKVILSRFVVKHITAEERLQMISDAAYYRAEHRCFQGDKQKQDWYEAEHEIDKRLATDPHFQSMQ